MTVKELPKHHGPQPLDWNKQKICWRFVQPSVDATDCRPSGLREEDGFNLAGGQRETSFLNAIYKAKQLNRVDKLFVTTANSGLCLCVFAGSETKEAAILSVCFPSL